MVFYLNHEQNHKFSGQLENKLLHHSLSEDFFCIVRIQLWISNSFLKEHMVLPVGSSLLSNQSQKDIYLLLVFLQSHEVDPHPQNAFYLKGKSYNLNPLNNEQKLELKKEIHQRYHNNQPQKTTGLSSWKLSMVRIQDYCNMN